MDKYLYTPQLLEKGIQYKVYSEIINELLAAGKTSGLDQSEEMVQYTRMNVQRMNRINKTILLNNDLLLAIQQLSSKYIALVITEAWCGDASQIVPVFNKIAKASSGKIDLKILWRDENLDLIDQHLTNGGRAIPKLIILDAETLEELVVWGPRPKIIQDLITEWRQDPLLTHADWAERAHAWYGKDKTQETQKELKNVILKLK
jgi:precorrin-6B methylase 2